MDNNPDTSKMLAALAATAEPSPLAGKTFAILVNAGSRVMYNAKPGELAIRVFDKFKRRLQRRAVFRRRSRVECALVRAAWADKEVGKLATNSHERKRYVAADRAERRKTRKIDKIVARMSWEASRGGTAIPREALEQMRETELDRILRTL